MRGYLLEVLAGRSWTRSDRTFWTKADAEREGNRLLAKGKAREVRILSVAISPEAVGVLNHDAEGGAA